MNIRKTLVGSLLAIALFSGAASPAAAQTNSAQIAALWAQVRALQAQIAALTGAPSGVQFTANMTVGSSGPEVSRLQSFLISRGHVIPAGATGYFGAQTAAAVAAFQVANGISPAVGYFGPLTRARVNAIITAATPGPSPTPTPSPSSDEDDADAAIENLKDAIADAQDDIDEAEDDGEDQDDIDDANDTLDEARDLLDEAEEAFDDEDYDEAIDLADEGMDLVDEALDQANVDTGDADEDDAQEALDDLDEAIDDAQDDIDEAEDDGEDDDRIDEANDLLDEARDVRDEAQNAFDDEDYDEVMDLVEEAEDLIDEALDEANVDGSDDDTGASDVSADADTVVVSGEDNDYAEFTLTFTVSAFGDDAFIPQDADDAFTYRIENASNGSTVSSGTTETAIIESHADQDGDYFRVDEGDEEEFTITVTFNPLPEDEGKSFRLQILTLEFGDSPSAPTSTWDARPENDYQTPSTYVND